MKKFLLIDNWCEDVEYADTLEEAQKKAEESIIETGEVEQPVTVFIYECSSVVTMSRSFKARKPSAKDFNLPKPKADVVTTKGTSTFP